MDRFLLLVLSPFLFVVYSSLNSKYDEDAYVAILTVWIAIYIYLFPWLVSWCRRHNNSLSIFVMNFFLGWTLVGWVAALIWGCFRGSV